MLVVGGRLYRAVLNVSGNGMALTTLQQIFSPFSLVTAVDFSGEGWLAVAGSVLSEGASCCRLGAVVAGGPAPGGGGGAVYGLSAEPGAAWPAWG